MRNSNDQRGEECMDKVITTAHGSGGRATGELIAEIFSDAFHDEMDDAALLQTRGSDRIAMTTDSFVVTPQFYAGGDIGRLAVCGTVNNLLMRGSRPSYLTAGFILEEGTVISDLRKAVHSMAETAKEAGVCIVAGDTKVIEGHGGSIPQFYINTAGVGLMNGWGVPVPEISAERAEPGDAILVSGTMGDHHAAILGERLSMRGTIQSDNAPLVDIVGNLIRGKVRVHTMRDITRGGLGTVLKELALSSGRVFHINEESIPVSQAVRSFAGMLGLDPLYMGNEGKILVIVDGNDAECALNLIRSSRYGEHAAVIGQVEDEKSGVPAGSVFLTTAIGGLRSIDVLQDEGLPRIC